MQNYLFRATRGVGQICAKRRRGQRLMAAAIAAIRNKKRRSALGLGLRLGDESENVVPTVFDDAPNKEIARLDLQKRSLNSEVYTKSTPSEEEHHL